MYSTEKELKLTKINQSEIENSQMTGGRIHETSISCSHISSSSIIGGSIDSMLIKRSFVELNSMEPCVNLSQLLNEYDKRLLDLQTQNNFLLKLLVTKGILEDEKELQELIDAHNLADKLSESESNN